MQLFSVAVAVNLHSAGKQLLRAIFDGFREDFFLTRHSLLQVMGYAPLHITNVFGAVSPKNDQNKKTQL